MSNKIEKKNLPVCGCTDGEQCDGECLVPRWIAVRVLAARNALISEDINEAYHHLYSIADPTFTSFDPWEALEEIAK